MAASPVVVTRGLVLRETETREADKILTLLSEDQGKISVIARGARRKNCKFAAAAQPLAWSEWTLYRRKDWYYVNEGATLELFEGLRGDLKALALAFYMAELTERVIPPGELAPELLRHLLNGLYALSTLHKSPALVKPAFEIKLLCLAGYEPLVNACEICGKTDPEEPMLDAALGTLRCKGCCHGGALGPLCPNSLAALRHIVYGDPKRLYSFRLGPDALARLNKASILFLFAQLEQGFKTLDFYESLGDEGR